MLEQLGFRIRPDYSFPYLFFFYMLLALRPTSQDSNASIEKMEKITVPSQRIMGSLNDNYSNIISQFQIICWKLRKGFIKTFWFFYNRNARNFPVSGRIGALVVYIQLYVEGDFNIHGIWVHHSGWSPSVQETEEVAFNLTYLFFLPGKKNNSI